MLETKGDVMKNFILITPSYDEAISKYTLNNFYTNAIKQSGGVPLVVPYENTDCVDDLLDLASGVLLSGGGDIHSKFYNEELHPEAKIINELRDTFEIELCKKALERDMPIFCICRGTQLLNVVLGGTLHQHIIGHVDPVGVIDEVEHSITVVEGTYFDEIYKNKTIKVNSIHHQALKDVAKGVEVLAYCDDIIEAVKVKDKTFVVGVQYHPERIYDNEESKMLFDEFVRQCDAYRSKH